MTYQQKTLPNDQDPTEHILTLDVSKNKQADALALLAIFKEETGVTPVMWGNSIIGFGAYDYVTSSGIEGVWPITGFSIQKARFSLYLKYDQDESQIFLDQIGKYKAGVSCVYVNKLQDIDEQVLRKFIKAGCQYMQSHFVTKDHI
ncbi:DUF1801 domain-containing protein [Aerococcus sp. 1KP-2016]|uniref:DUF1801 domain-containing protein n=1 Tax=Aerococcus sp. 1KP-2016 TaxID=1981982 RepID=UPI000B99A1AB|nr:DUF1801 domain-containing protein [Aerococcus sp. 1KP-2016]OYQ67617.1 hypothetical protein B9P78_03215 [Aerococcus sp. 1KP-2016]